MYGDRIRFLRQAFAQSTAELRRRIATINNDKYLPPDVKDERTKPLVDELGKQFDAAKVRAAEVLAEARKKMHAREPRRLQLEAAVKQPAARQGVADMLDGMSLKDLRQLVDVLQQEGNAAGAHAVRAALASGKTAHGHELKLEEKDVASLHTSLDPIGTDGFEQMLAEVVGAQNEIMLLECAGPFSSADDLLRDPLKLAQAARAARVVAFEHGAESFSEDEAARLCRLAGVPTDKTDIS